MLKIQPGDDASENGFDCDAHIIPPRHGSPLPALEVGTPDHPIDAKRTALIRLNYVAELDKESCPAIICGGGRMDFHGAPLSGTWVKLGTTARKGDTAVTLTEPVTGWRAGDRLIVTATGLTRDDGRGKGVPIYLHDYYGPNRHAKVVSTKAKDNPRDFRTTM